MSTILITVLAALALMSVGLLKSYRHVSERELKRRARAGDELAAALYRAAAYGPSLGAVLWFLVIVTNALFFVSIARTTPTWFAFIVSAVLIWFAFLWLPAREVTHFSTRAAAQLAPALAWLLNYLHPIVSRVNGFIARHRPVSVHTGLYDREDLLRLLQDQKVQPDNRIDEVSLDIAFHSLTFADVLVRDVMIPRRAVKMVSVDTEVGPVLMSELHGSGFSRFPVYAGDKDTVVGTLFLRDLVRAKQGGRIEKVMQSDLTFIHEEQPLADALQAILKTHRQQYVVVNSFEEYVGIITMEDVLEQIVGKPIIDEFDQYDDLRAVARRAAQKEHQAHKHEKKEENTDEAPTEESPEVVK
ncbi:MAG TPA: CBS domain-containing protein [Candidatus Limnocylindria bacterium]|nr:CBS domain-containing protein [Candidatus Limnocylindria bacterium]